MVRKLILGFVSDEWLQGLDCGTLARVPGSYVTEAFRSRSDDIVWRVRVSRDRCLRTDPAGSGAGRAVQAADEAAADRRERVWRAGTRLAAQCRGSGFPDRTSGLTAGDRRPAGRLAGRPAGPALDVRPLDPGDVDAQSGIPYRLASDR
ncbi:MAG: hypothetical protein HT579_12215 [Candidatus Accumulibacter similis]|nr:MAG: hypothetical protein HT579_12215 [Candidatus Accumulibacter similis]